LTHLVCPKCGEECGFERKECQNCGTVTGKVWWAIIWWTWEQAAATAKRSRDTAVLRPQTNSGLSVAGNLTAEAKYHRNWVQVGIGQPSSLTLGGGSRRGMA